MPSNPKDKQRAYARKHYLANKAKYIERAKAWAAANPEKMQACRDNWSEANPEKRKVGSRAAAKRAYIADPEKFRRKSRVWHAENPEKSKAKIAKWRAENPEQMRDQHRKWYDQNIDLAKAIASKWRKENPEKVVTHTANRRARKLAAGGKLTAGDIKEIVFRQKGRCAVCREKSKLEMDHIMPLALGGSGHVHNFQGLCRSCNGKKHAKHPIDFNRSLGLLL